MAQPETKIGALIRRLPSWRRLTEFEAKRILDDARDLARVHVAGEERAQIHVIAGIVWMNLGKPQDALDEFCAGRHFAPDDYSIRLNTGVALAHLGRNEEALEEYLGLADLMGEAAWQDVPLLCNTSDVLSELRQRSEGLTLLDKAAAGADMHDEEALWFLAVASAALREHVRAVTYLDSFLGIRHGRGSDADPTILTLFDSLGGWEELDELYMVYPALRESVAYVQALRDSFEAPAGAPSSPEAEAERQRVMEAFAPLRERANAARRE